MPEVAPMWAFVKWNFVVWTGLLGLVAIVLLFHHTAPLNLADAYLTDMLLVASILFCFSSAYTTMGMK